MNKKLLPITFSILFIVSCGGGGGGGSDPVTPTPTVNLSAEPTSVLLESTSTLTWSSTNATSCSASWTTQTGTSGSEAVSITTAGNNSFSITCSSAGGSGSASVTVEGYRNTDGVVVDGYISGAEVFIDEDDDWVLDTNENSTTSDNEGKFTIKYANGNLISIGGTDLDSQTLLDNLLITHKLTGHSDFKAVTPVTSIAAFMEDASLVNSALGIDASIDVFTFDPVANKGDGGINDYLYEKGNQLTVLAFALQNITNNLNTSTETTQDYFKAITEEIEKEYTETETKVDIETEAFVTKVLDNVIAAKSVTIDETAKVNTAKSLAGVMPIIAVKSENDLTTAVIRFAISTLQTDIQAIANGTATAEIVTSYTEDVINYIAEDQNIDASKITPDISAIADSATTSEDTAVEINVLLNDSYVTSAPFSLSAINGTNGSTSISNNLITYSPDADYNGSDSFSYTITQGDKTSSADVTVTIEAVNDAPTIDIALTIKVNENQTAVTTVSVSDVDGDELTLTLGGTDADSFNLSDENVLTFKEAPDYEIKSSYAITLSLTDGTETVTQDVTIAITNVNDVAPDFTSEATFSAAENQTAIGTVTATDAEGDEVAFTITGDELAITSAGVLTFVSAPDYETKTSYTATVTASDGTNSTTQNLTINVTDVNEAPAFTSSATFSAAENQTAIGLVSVSDPENTTLSYSLSGTDASSLAISTAGVLTFVSAPDYETKDAYTATVTASDGTNSTTQNLTINVTDQNDAPTIYDFFPSNFYLTENGGKKADTVIGTGCGTLNNFVTCGAGTIIINGDQKNTVADQDNDSLSYSITGADAQYINVSQNGFSEGGGAISLKENADYETKNVYIFTFNVSDGEYTTSKNTQINILDVDEKPVLISSNNISIDENTETVLKIEARDPEGKSISYRLGASNQGNSTRFNITSDGVLTLKEYAQDYEGYPSSEAYVYIEDDGNSRSPTQFNVSLNNLNDNSPSFTSSATFSAAENQTAIGTVAASDVDGDTITYSISGSDITINSSSGVIAFASAPDYETKSSYTATVTASDGTNSTTQDITVNVSNANESPTFTSSATFSAEENQTTIGSVSVTDPENATLSYSLSGTDASSLAISSSGVLSFGSAPNYESKNSYSATVTVSDGTNTSTQVITINITDVNEAPYISQTTFNTNENETSVDVGSTVIDEDGDTITYSVGSGWGFDISSSGVLTLENGQAFDYETQSVYYVQIGISDGSLGYFPMITITVNNLNENSPVFTSSATLSAAENQTSIDTVTATDADGDTITYSVSGTDSGSVSINSSSGVLTFNSAPNYESKTSYSIVVTASDGTNSTTQDVTISVTDVNDAPVATAASYYMNLKPQSQTSGTLTLAGTDEDGDTLTYSIVSNGSYGRASLSGTTITYQTDASTQSAQTESFTFKVNDGTVDSSAATISIDLRTDPLYKYQWHLNNTGQTNFATNAGTSGVDLNVDTAISSGYTGNGVTVAVLDSGLEIAHEDLVDNIISGSYDFLNSDTDPTNPANDGDHGTSVAGLIAAKGWNNKGGRGVAPNASLIGYNYLKNQSLSNQLKAWGSNPPVSVDVDIYNMSYGAGYGVDENDDPNTTYNLPSFLSSSYIAGLTNGLSLRNNKGAIYIKSSGNGYDTSATSDCGSDLTCTDMMIDNYSAMPYIIHVGALQANGDVSSYTTPGSALWISGFGGENGGNESIVNGQGYSLTSGIYKPAMMTVDQSGCTNGYAGSNGRTPYYNEFENPSGHSENSSCNYTSTFNGTSSAAPTVAGVVALMLEANPALTWRDVKHIIATTADQVGSDSDYTYTFSGIKQYEWETNSAGYKFHNWFGFGKIDAAEAVTTAASYTANSRGSFVSTNFVNSGSINLAINDNGTNATSSLNVTKPSGSNDFVEFVTLSVQLSHPVPKSIGLRLQSPDGTIINVMTPMSNIGTNPSSTIFQIGVAGLYGESIEGTWTLAVNDYIVDSTPGTLTYWGITVYGN